MVDTLPKALSVTKSRGNSLVRLKRQVDFGGYLLRDCQFLVQSGVAGGK